MIQLLDLRVEDLVCAFCDLEACHIGLVGVHLPDQVESNLWMLNEMAEEVKDAIRGYSSPSSLTMFNLRQAMKEDQSFYHKWPDIMERSLKFPKFPSKLPSPSPTVSPGTPSTIPSLCSPRTCPSMPPTSPPSTSRGAASARPGWRASAPPSTGMGSMPTTTYSRGSFRSSAVPGCKSVARMCPGSRRTSSPGMGIRRRSGPSLLSLWSSSRG